MKIKFVEFYRTLPTLPSEQNKNKRKGVVLCEQCQKAMMEHNRRKKNAILGTVHIYIEDYDLDFKGIYVKKGKMGLKYSTPGAMGEVDGVAARFPYLNFRDREKNREIIKFLQREVTPIILERARNSQNRHKIPVSEDKKPIQPTKYIDMKEYALKRK